MDLAQVFLFLSGGTLFLGVFLVLFLMTQEGRDRRSKQILGLLILACALNSAHPVLVVALGLPRSGSHQFFEPLQFLLAPLMTAYAASLLEGGFPLRARHALHFLPAAFAGAVAVVFSLHRNGSPLITLALWSLLAIQMLAYLAPAVRILRRYQDSLKARVSNLDRVDLDWLRWFYYVAVSLCVVAWAVLFLLLHQMSRSVLSRGISLAMAAAVWVLGYRGLRQKIPETPEILPIEETPESAETSAVSAKLETPEGSETDEPPLVPRPTLPKPEALRLKGALLETLEKKKPYLEPELGLADLARLLEVPRNQLSAVINQELGVNFYDLVNGYRVREFRALLADPRLREEKILTLAFDAGFNSKPTFNKVVLKQTGKTPSQLREEEIESRPSR
jgi:AraC-like DNA-binding protein